MNNLDIRLLVSEKKLTFKAIAEEMGVGRTYLSRIMGKKLSVKNKLLILEAINKLKKTDDENLPEDNDET